MTDYFYQAAGATQAAPATEGNREDFRDLLHARLNSHCKALSYKKKKKKRLKHTRNLFRKNLHLISVC